MSLHFFCVCIQSLHRITKLNQKVNNFLIQQQFKSFWIECNRTSVGLDSVIRFIQQSDTGLKSLMSF